MIPYKQTLEDNCVQTCIASILDMELDLVPHFLYMLETPEKWVCALRSWLKSFSLDLIRMDGHFPISGIYLVTGKTHRQTRHMVIYKGGKLFHDVHVDATGLKEIDSTFILVPYNPSSVILKDTEISNGSYRT